MNIPVIILKDEGSVYGVIVPDIPYCFSCGDTIEQAMQNVKEAIYSHIELLLELEEPVNFTASSIDELIINPDYQSAIWMLVDVDVDKLNVTPAHIFELQ